MVKLQISNKFPRFLCISLNPWNQPLSKLLPIFFLIAFLPYLPYPVVHPSIFIVLHRRCVAARREGLHAWLGLHPTQPLPGPVLPPTAGCSGCSGGLYLHGLGVGLSMTRDQAPCSATPWADPWCVHTHTHTHRRPFFFKHTIQLQPWCYCFWSTCCTACLCLKGTRNVGNHSSIQIHT